MIRRGAHRTDRDVSGVGCGNFRSRFIHNLARSACTTSTDGLLFQLRAFHVGACATVLGLEISYVLDVLLAGICLLILGKFGSEYLLGIIGL